MTLLGLTKLADRLDCKAVHTEHLFCRIAIDLVIACLIVAQTTGEKFPTTFGSDLSLSRIVLAAQNFLWFVMKRWRELVHWAFRILSASFHRGAAREHQPLYPATLFLRWNIKLVNILDVLSQHMVGWRIPIRPLIPRLIYHDICGSGVGVQA